MPTIPRVATIVWGVLTLACVSLNVTPGLITPAVAQSARPQQFAITIKQRKVEAAANVIRVNQGDAVEIVLTSDEAAELHLHGYDLLLALAPNVPATMRFTAKIAGRFPLEAHRFGAASSSQRHRGAGALLYVEVLPR
jgi:FtsP/CotA-like multicopper oxidase with cupredoxin domain